MDFGSLGFLAVCLLAFSARRQSARDKSGHEIFCDAERLLLTESRCACTVLDPHCEEARSAVSNHEASLARGPSLETPLARPRDEGSACCHAWHALASGGNCHKD